MIYLLYCMILGNAYCDYNLSVTRTLPTCRAFLNSLWKCITLYYIEVNFDIVFFNGCLGESTLPF